MYLASFESDTTKIMQACVRLTPSWDMSDKVRSDWTHSLRQCLGLLMSSWEMNCALRVIFREDKQIELVLTSTLLNKSESDHHFVGFDRLNSLIDGSVSFPCSREEHDAIWGNFPDLRCRVTAPPFKSKDTWFACNFRIGPFLDELFLEIEPFDYRLSYQVNVCRIAIDSQWIVNARKNAMRIARLPGVTLDVIKMQEDLACHLVNASTIVEEYLGVESPEAVKVAMESLKHHFNLQFARLRFETPHFKFTQSGYEDALSLGIHSSLLDGLNVDDVYASAADDSTSVELLSWSPSDRLTQRLAAISDKSIRKIQGKLSVQLKDSFDIFLSHNSNDKPIVRRLASALRSRGMNVWLDEWELVPGRPWQDALEEIIQTAKSAAVLVGKDGLGPWEAPEMRACLDQFVKRQLPVIPVLLPGTFKIPDLPIFLRQFTWVDLRSGLTAEGLDRIQWGITGIKPNP